MLVDLGDDRIGDGRDLQIAPRDTQGDAGVRTVQRLQREVHHRLDGLLHTIGIVQLDRQPGEPLGGVTSSQIDRGHLGLLWACSRASHGLAVAIHIRDLPKPAPKTHPAPAEPVSADQVDTFGGRAAPIG
ncbi:hypothetical protein [Kribbella sp. NBC_00662]|uniref:hypothetical protein n=1 Tax=Kribbella sp. NBC_00662 TaxID=2975969 RepID=UPI00352A01E7